MRYASPGAAGWACEQLTSASLRSQSFYMQTLFIESVHEIELEVYFRC